MKYSLLGPIITFASLVSNSLALLNGESVSTYTVLSRATSELSPIRTHLGRRELGHSSHRLVRRGPAKKAKISEPSTPPPSHSDSKRLSKSWSHPPSHAGARPGTDTTGPSSRELRRTAGWMTHGNKPMTSMTDRIPGRLDNPLGIKSGRISKVARKPPSKLPIETGPGSSSGLHKSKTSTQLSQGLPTDHRISVERLGGHHAPQSPFAVGPSSSRELRIPTSPFATADSGSEKMDWSPGSSDSPMSEKSSASTRGKPPRAHLQFSSAATNLADQMQKMTTSERPGR